MPKQSISAGSSPLSWLDRYWVSRSNVPVSGANERLLLICSEHWIKFVFPTFIALALGGTGLALMANNVDASRTSATSAIAFLAGVLLLTCAHHWFFWFLLSESQADIIVTSKRAIHLHSGLLWKEDIVEIAFERMKTVESHTKNVLQTVLNYGTLVFEGNKAKIPLVPRPGAVARQIEQAMGMI